jgi:site-specific recombinase XerD
MLFAGLRVDEVSLLDVTDIEINERSGSVRVRNGKGSKERVVPLGRSARRAIGEWMNCQGNSPATVLFTGKASKRLTTRQIERIVSALGDEARIPGLSPHWLRYHYAKSLEKSGVAIEKIRDLLGHGSIETTRRYLASSFEELQNAVEAM